MTYPGACGPTAYAYDAENRLLAVADATYTYDGDGKRVKKALTAGGGKLYWMGNGADALAESDLAGNLTAEFIFFNGKRIARVDGNGSEPSPTVHYYFSDHLGSSNVVTSAAGGIEEESDFYPYGGEVTVANSLPDQDYKFTGKERDQETGLHNFGARFYSDKFGRFLTTDPFNPIIGFDEEEDEEQREESFKQYLTEPRNWNRYTYSLGNPTLYVDPDGNAPVLAPLLVAGGALMASPAGQRVADLAQRYGPQVARLATTAGNAVSSRVYTLAPVVRGQVIELLRGGTQAFRNFPVVDKFSNGVVTSIKSIDVFAKSYQSAGALFSRLSGYVDKVASFTQGRLGNVDIKVGDVSSRVLEIVIPKGPLTPAQQQTLNSVVAYGNKLGVEVKILQAQ